MNTAGTSFCEVLGVDEMDDQLLCTDLSVRNAAALLGVEYFCTATQFKKDLHKLVCTNVAKYLDVKLTTTDYKEELITMLSNIGDGRPAQDLSDDDVVDVQEEIKAADNVSKQVRDEQKQAKVNAILEEFQNKVDASPMHKKLKNGALTVVNTSKWVGKVLVALYFETLHKYDTLTAQEKNVIATAIRRFAKAKYHNDPAALEELSVEYILKIMHTKRKSLNKAKGADLNKAIKQGTVYNVLFF